MENCHGWGSECNRVLGSNPGPGGTLRQLLTPVAKKNIPKPGKKVFMTMLCKNKKKFVTNCCPDFFITFDFSLAFKIISSYSKSDFSSVF